MKNELTIAPNRLTVEALLAEVQKLQQHRHYRDTSGLFYIEGVRNFVQVMDNRFDVATIIYSEKLLTAPLARKLVRQSRREGINTVAVTPEEFRKVSVTERASGVAAIVRQRWVKLEEASPQAGLCWLALDTVRSPGNLGTLIRTSEAVGGAGLIFTNSQTDPFDPDVVRASMGAFFRQRFVRTNFTKLGLWMNRHCCQGIGASPDGSYDFHRFNYPPSSVLFLGEERQGLTQPQRDLCGHLVQIPILGAADSLNLGVAGSLLMYEIYRSKRLCG